jgi:hypothetical protein
VFWKVVHRSKSDHGTHYGFGSGKYVISSGYEDSVVAFTAAILVMVQSGLYAFFNVFFQTVEKRRSATVCWPSLTWLYFSMRITASAAKLKMMGDTR